MALVDRNRRRIHCRRRDVLAMICGKVEAIGNGVVRVLSDGLLHTLLPMHFDAAHLEHFKLEFQPGQLDGGALNIRFITSCGTSSRSYFMVPE